MGLRSCSASRGTVRNRNDLIETLAVLAGKRLIEGLRDEQPVALDRQTIIAALEEPGPVDNPFCIFYILTQEGGDVWQAFAAPNWSDFVKEELDNNTRSG